MTSVMYQLWCTGSDRDGWTVFDYELEDNVKATLEEWAKDDLLDQFGFGDGKHPCEAHKELESGCIDCLNEETQVAHEAIERWAERQAGHVVAELLEDGHCMVDMRGRDRLPHQLMSFRLRKVED